MSSAYGDLGSLAKCKEFHAQIDASNLPNTHNNDFLPASLITMYGKCGGLDEAMRVFQNATSSSNRHPRADVWNAIIGAHARQGRSKEAIQLFDRMISLGVRPDMLSFLTVIPACGDLGELSTCERIYSLLLRPSEIPRIRINAYLGAALITMYAKCGALDRADSILNLSRDTNSDTQDTTSLWNAIIGAHAKQANGKRALSLFEEMTRSGSLPDRTTFLAVLTACGETGDLARGKLLHARLKETLTATPTNNTNNTHDSLAPALITMYSKCGALDEAVSVFEALENPDTIAWTALITAYAREGHHAKVVELFKAMMLKEDIGGLNPDGVTFAAVFSSCGKLGDLEKAQDVHDILISRNVPIDDFLETALISMYSKCGALEKALGVWHEMRRKGRKIGEVGAWNAILGALATTEEGAVMTLSFFEQMEKEGVSPDQITYLAVLSCCGRVAWITKGKEIHSQILRKGIPIGEYLSAALIDMYGKSGELEEARAVFYLIRLKSPNECGVSTWNAIIGAYGDYRRTKEVLSLFEEMVSTGRNPPPDEMALCAVLSACSHSGMVDDALQLIQYVAPKYGIIPNTFHHNCVIEALGRAGRLEEAEKYLVANKSTNDVSWMSFWELVACARNDIFRNCVAVDYRTIK